MPWSVPRFSRKQVDVAGQYLAIPPPLFQKLSEVGRIANPDSDVLEIVNNWRDSHNLPLFVMRRTLERRAKKISEYAILAQRIKRLPSISRKIKENEFRHLKLSKIQDIGGCRAIMPDMGDVFSLVGKYLEGDIASEFVRVDDHIAKPKEDGYRSVHLIYKYKSESEKYRIYDNHRIEIQIRSLLQHAWATALETAETFSGMELRRKAGSMLLRPKEYLVNWRRFFVLMASAIAFSEFQPNVPGAPDDQTKMLAELRALGEELHVEQALLAWRNSVKAFDTLATFRKEIGEKKAILPYWFLLQLDPKQKSVRVKVFKKEDNLRAFDEYVNAEKPIRDAPGTQVVLVSVDSIGELKKAYPNYFADTSIFVNTYVMARDHNNGRLNG